MVLFDDGSGRTGRGAVIMSDEARVREPFGREGDKDMASPGQNLVATTVTLCFLSSKPDDDLSRCKSPRGVIGVQSGANPFRKATPPLFLSVSSWEQEVRTASLAVGTPGRGDDTAVATFWEQYTGQGGSVVSKHLSCHAAERPLVYLAEFFLFFFFFLLQQY